MPTITTNSMCMRDIFDSSLWHRHTHIREYKRTGMSEQISTFFLCERKIARGRLYL